VAAAQVGKKLLEYTSVYPHFKEPTCWWVSIIKVDTSREVLYLGTCTHVAQGSVQMVKIVWDFQQIGEATTAAPYFQAHTGRATRNVFQEVQKPR